MTLLRRTGIAVILTGILASGASSQQTGTPAVVILAGTGLHESPRRESPITAPLRPGQSLQLIEPAAGAVGDERWYRASAGPKTGFVPGDAIATIFTTVGRSGEGADTIVGARTVDQDDGRFMELVVLAAGERRASIRHRLPGTRADVLGLRLPAVTGLSPAPLLVAAAYRNDYPLVDGELFFSLRSGTIQPVLSIVYSHTADEKRGSCVARSRETKLIFPGDPGGSPNRVRATTTKGCYRMNASKKEDFVVESTQDTTYTWDGSIFRED